MIELEIVKFIYPEAIFDCKLGSIKNILRKDIDLSTAIIRGASINGDDETTSIPNNERYLNIACTSGLFQYSRTDIWLHESWSISHYWRFCERGTKPISWDQIPNDYRKFNSDMLITEYLSDSSTLQKHSNMITLLSTRYGGIQLPVIPPPYPKAICRQEHPTTDEAISALVECLNRIPKQLTECCYSSAIFRQINIALQLGVNTIYICGYDTDLQAYYTNWESHSTHFRSLIGKETWGKFKQLVDIKTKSQKNIHPVAMNNMFLPILLEYVRQIKRWAATNRKTIEFKYMGNSKQLSRIFSE